MLKVMLVTTQKVHVLVVFHFVMTVSTQDELVANMLQRVLKWHKAICYYSCMLLFLVCGV